MNLIISGELTPPPGEVAAFRTLTLYATTFKRLDCLVECKKEEIDLYYHWLKSNWSYDFVEAMVKIDEENGIKIRHSKYIDRLTFNNLGQFIRSLEYL
jgi:hypothetical protein